MDGLHLVMPMAGGGTRFAGYSVPKPMIKLNEKPMFYWAVQSIVRYIDTKDIVFVVLKSHVDEYGIDRLIHSYYPDARIHVIPQITRGAVETCLEGIKEIDDDLPILLNDCDHAFSCHTFVRFIRENDFGSCEGALLTFTAESPNYSYVMLDASGSVIGTREKEVVSHEAICGAYYFRSRIIFEEAAKRYLTNCGYTEYYTSGVYNEMVKMGHRIKIFPVDEHIPFGTPDEYKRVNSEIGCNLFANLLE